MTSDRRSATRDRLLEVAAELFYDQGVQSTTVDAVAQAAGHAKPTVYTAFGSKERLLRAVLERRFEQRRRTLEALVAAVDDPREQLNAVLDNQTAVVASKGFRGCPLVIAAVELPESAACRHVTRRYKRWYRRFLASLAGDAGLTDPEAVAGALLLLIEGANVLAYVEGAPSIRREARRAAEALIRQHEPQR